MANNAAAKTPPKPATTATMSSASRGNAQAQSMQPMPDLIDYVREYARQKPEVAAMWCFGIGFVVGWKLKPW
ncbi:hypothetical protein [Aeoliella sp. SH292]|uniref:hypothetical protein n=1 Tax=Aeoliella sp. SH292 TaxID=3454464 RepID=UPI003F98DAFC